MEFSVFPFFRFIYNNGKNGKTKNPLLADFQESNAYPRCVGFRGCCCVV